MAREHLGQVEAHLSRTSEPPPRQVKDYPSSPRGLWGGVP